MNPLNLEPTRERPFVSLSVMPKSVWLVLLLYFLMKTGYQVSLYLSFYFLGNDLNILKTDSSVLSFCEFGFLALMYVFFPLGGWIGDVGCGRYKTIKGSLLFLMVMLVIPVAVSCVNLVHPSLSVPIGAEVFIVIILTCLVVIGVVGAITFIANAVPFAMDQLRDAPTNQSSLFICLYVWIMFLSALTVELVIMVFSKRSNFNGLILVTLGTAANIVLGLSSAVVLISLLIFRVILQKKESWFNTEPCRVNPYKLVYKVTKFACHHKRPIRRSAFTYCEDDLPSGLDLGKSKYGGPFTTEEVEDVKVFYEILKVLISVGPVLYLIYVISDETQSFRRFKFKTNHSEFYFGMVMNQMQNTVTVVAIPVYLLLSHYLKLPTFQTRTRLETGIVLMLLNMMLKLAVNIVSHVKYEHLSCMFHLSEEDNVHVFTTLQIASVGFVGQVLASFSQILIYVSLFEFVCAQSPQSMKGMIIGMLYTAVGFANLLGLVLQIPFRYNWKYSYPSCGFVYYCMNIVIGLVSFVIFTLVVRRYKFRERDEPSRERQFAEEYYSNIQQEPNYDYSISM